MVRYAVANTPYFCTLFNSHSLILGGYWHRQNILLTQELIHLSGQILQQFLAIHPQPVHLAVVLLQALLLVLMQVQIGKI